MSNHDEQIVIITGAGGGLGREISCRLLRDGFRCVLADLTAESVEQTIQMNETNRERAKALACDIRKPRERARLIETAASMPGELFGLVNNAGVARMRPLLEESIEEWRMTLETNLESAFFLSQAAIEQMRKHGTGRIVNIASIHGIVGLNNDGLDDRAPSVTPDDRGPVRESAYAASKGALIQMSRDLAAAVGRWGITVNSLSPGNIPHNTMSCMSHKPPPNDHDTRPPQLGDPIAPQMLQAMAKQTMLNRIGRVEEIAGPVSFLLSEDASYITGANLVVDGGFTSW